MSTYNTSNEDTSNTFLGINGIIEIILHVTSLLNPSRAFYRAQERVDFEGEFQYIQVIYNIYNYIA